MPAFLPNPAQDLINRMLTVDPAKRITIAQIKEHKWYTCNMPDPSLCSPSLSIEDMVRVILYFNL
jgi:serine/threonine protein kinase